jgi:hypothetical protein
MNESIKGNLGLLGAGLLAMTPLLAASAGLLLLLGGVGTW